MRIGVLESQLAEERARHAGEMEAARAGSAREAEEQRREGEAALKRHLEFIERLLKDKEDLSSRCEELAGRLEAAKGRMEAQGVALREEYQREVKR